LTCPDSANPFLPTHRLNPKTEAESVTKTLNKIDTLMKKLESYRQLQSEMRQIDLEL
jgi:hypothetical protein